MTLTYVFLYYVEFKLDYTKILILDTSGSHLFLIDNDREKLIDIIKLKDLKSLKFKGCGFSFFQPAFDKAGIFGGDVYFLTDGYLTEKLDFTNMKSKNINILVTEEHGGIELKYTPLDKPTVNIITKDITL